MKTAILVVMMVALTMMFGCKTTSERGGAPQTEQGFKVVAPASETLKQGETKTITVRLNRGDYFKQNVQLSARTSREDVTIEPTQVTVMSSDVPEVQLRLGANPQAALGEYRVYLTATPEQGAPASVSFPVNVKAP